LFYRFGEYEMGDVSESEITGAFDVLIKEGAAIELAFVLIDKRKLILFSKYISEDVERFVDKLDTIILALALNRKLGYLPRPVLEALTELYPHIMVNISYIPDAIYVKAYTFLDSLSGDAEQLILRIISDQPTLVKPYLIPLFLKFPKLAEASFGYGGFVTAAAVFALGKAYEKKIFMKKLKRFRKLMVVDVDSIIKSLKKNLSLENALKAAGININELFKDVNKRFKISPADLKLSKITIEALMLNMNGEKQNLEVSPIAYMIGKIFKKRENKRKILESILFFTRSSKFEIRVAAIESIIQLYEGSGDLSLKPILMSFLNDKNEEVRKIAISGIAKIYKGTDNVLDVFNSLLSFIKIDSFDVANSVAFAIKQLLAGSKYLEIALSNLRTIMAEKDPYRVSVAILSIGYLSEGTRNKQIKKFLLNYINHENPVLRCAAIGALGSLFASTGDIRILDILEKNLLDVDSEVRKYTARAIGSIFRGTPQDLYILKRFHPYIRSKNEEKRICSQEIIEFLFRNSGRELEALKVLKNYLYDAYWVTRKSLVNIITRMYRGSGKEMEAISFLLPFLRNESKHVRGTVSEILGLLIRNGPLERETVPLFKKYLEDPNKYVRR